MATGYVLYNKKAGFSEDREAYKRLGQMMDCSLNYIDITRVTNYRTFFCGMEPEDFVIISGGDGTLNHFVNDTADIPISCQILYFPCGTGNDFAKEMDHEKGCKPFPITQYIKDLPTVTVKGKTYHFVNGVGYGIDGFCCEMGDELRKTATKPVNYTKIAIQGILFRYVPTSAVITVDGAVHRYKKVWLAPTMYGKHYGGGMIPTPQQKRGSGELSVMVYHDTGRLKALRVFPSIFRGEHIQHTDMVEVLTGKEITVEFGDSRSLQIDGETILSVKAYTAKAPAQVAETVC